jgi:hypothetical protein
MRSLPATVLLLLILGGLVTVRIVSTDRNPPTPTAPTPLVHAIKQLLIPGPVPFQTLFWNSLGLPRTGVIAISDPGTWSALWRNQTLCYISNTCSSQPHVDFDSRTILIVAAGMQGSSGYRINVTSIVAAHDNVSVDATLTTPGLNCFEAAVITNPSQVIEIPQTNLPLTFNMTEEHAPACPY